MKLLIVVLLALASSHTFAARKAADNTCTLQKKSMKYLMSGGVRAIRSEGTPEGNMDIDPLVEVIENVMSWEDCYDLAVSLAKDIRFFYEYEVGQGHIVRRHLYIKWNYEAAGRKRNSKGMVNNQTALFEHESAKGEQRLNEEGEKLVTTSFIIF